jgi:hypothetical protein
MASSIITLTRKDQIFNPKPSPYATPENIEALRTIGITEESIMPFLNSLAKCSSYVFLNQIAIFFVFMIIFPFLLYLKMAFKNGGALDSETFTYIFLPILIYCEVVMLIAILIFTFILHRQMLRKAQHIIDIQNKRQLNYKFSLSALMLRLSVEKIRDFEAGLNSSSFDEPLKEIYTFPGMQHITDYIKLGYFNESDVAYKLYCFASVKYQTGSCKFLVLALLMVLLLVGGFTISIIFAALYLDLMYISYIVITWFTIIGGFVLAIYQYNMSKLASYLETQNSKIRDLGIFCEVTNWVLHIYVFDNIEGSESYKDHVRTAKYFK